MKKGKVIVPLALCVCAVLIVIGIALGNNPIRSSVGQSQSAEMNFPKKAKLPNPPMRRNRQKVQHRAVKTRMQG